MITIPNSPKVYKVLICGFYLVPPVMKDEEMDVLTYYPTLLYPSTSSFGRGFPRLTFLDKVNIPSLL